MLKRILLASALLLACCQPAFAAPPSPVAPTLSASEALAICDKALDAALAGHDGRAVVADAVKALPEDQQHAVLGFCGVYMAGAVAMLKRVTAAPALPAGGKSVSI